MDILKYTALELSGLIKKGEIGVEEAVKAAFDSVAAREELLHCYVTVDREKALAQAVRVQKGIASGEFKSPLAGVPIAIKDNICTEGTRTTCASRMLEDFVPTYSATAVRRLEVAGTVILGKTNMDEFAMGSTTETSYFGPTRNPWDTNRAPGGSSGGSAAAVAAGECFAALGSDTGGSIRQPASFCGVVGMKPTYGTISRSGLIAYASSLDQIGPLTKDVADCAAMLEALAAYDPSDSTSIRREAADFSTALTGEAKGLRIGIPRDYFGPGLEPSVKEAVMEGARALERRGAVLEEFELGLVKYAVPAYYTIASAEAGSNLERFDGMKYGYRAEGCGGLHETYKKSRSEGFGPEVRRRILLGAFVLSSGYYDAYYLKALKVRALIKKAFDEAFSRYDIILGPAAPSTAPKLGESLTDPIQMYLGDIYTISVNLAGLPAICIPCGRDGAGLPVGVQLIGNVFQEKKLLRAADAGEQEMRSRWRNDGIPAECEGL